MFFTSSTIKVNFVENRIEEDAANRFEGDFPFYAPDGL